MNLNQVEHLSIATSPRDKLRRSSCCGSDATAGGLVAMLFSSDKLAFIRFSDRIGSDMKSWRRSLKIKCANHPDVNPNGTCKWIGDYRSSGACQPARQRAGQPAGLGSFLHSDPCTQAALRIRRPGKLYRARSRL